MRAALFFGSALLILEAIYLYFYLVPESVHTMLSTAVFLIALGYAGWFFIWSKPYAELYERVAEGAIIAAVVFNPFFIFTLDIGVWIFLDIVFGWIFFIYTFEVFDLRRKYMRDRLIRKMVKHEPKRA